MEKYKNLDGLRGIAALVVVICHYVAAFIPSADGSPAARHFRHEHLIASTPLHLPFAGNFAVCIFFVLSGFVLSSKFFKTKDQSVLVSSAVRRYFRLMLPAIVSVVIAYLIIRLGLAHNQAAAQTTGSLWLASFWNFPAHLGSGLWEGVYSAFFTGNVIYNPTLWTMKYELFGSFLIFMFLSLFGRLDKRWVFYGVLFFVFLNSYYLPFLIGVALSDAWTNFRHTALRLPSQAAWAFLVMGLILGGWFTPVLYPSIYSHVTLPFFVGDQLAQLAHTLGATCVIVAVLRLQHLTRLLEIRPVQYLGKVSFSLYLVHFVLLGSVGSYLFVLLLPHAGYAISFLATSTLSLALTFATAHFYMKLVDVPSIQLSRLIGDRLMQKNRPSTVPQSSPEAEGKQPLNFSPEASL